MMKKRTSRRGLYAPCFYFMKRLLVWVLFLGSCTYTVPEGRKTNSLPEVFPDYAGVTIPPNIAPLNFALATEHTEAYAVFQADGRTLTVKENGSGQFRIPERKWQELVRPSAGRSIAVTIYAKEAGKRVMYDPFLLYIAAESVDPYIAYRLIEPGYELWHHMGIYQRNLESFAESAIMENKMSGENCMNCHSFCMQNPDKMLFHMRGVNQGTILIDGDRIEKLNTKADGAVSAFVYPSWHPSGRYVAFSVNETRQAFHQNDRNRVEVFDLQSDVLVYDVEKHEAVTTDRLFSKEAFETFPTFSPDGRTLYFCSAAARDMPKDFKEIRYSLCAISFDPETRGFGSRTDTLYNAETEGKSVTFPRVSPDGKHLLYTLSDYGNFPVWHTEADLYMIDLSTGEHHPLEQANSAEATDSYHSWSSNSRWIVFGSRRTDGLYTRPYIAYIDTTGNSAKPFLLPQKDTEFYARFMKSYNIPEFITGKVRQQGRKIGLTAKEEKGIDVGKLIIR
ncbi:translocation protein TolB [Bacteroidales bacterium Barb6]|nr:translocation protein TolB [Bacteroidales bacterium Barb6]